MHRIRINLWFDSEAEEAARFYCGVFKDSRLGKVTAYPAVGRESTGKEPGSVMTVEFELDGQPFIALNGGPDFTFNEAISLEVRCEDQAEVDYYWERLGAGGDPSAQQCGWLKDRYGVSWQIVPAILMQMLEDSDPARVERTFAAMLEMKKLDIVGLVAAYEKAETGRRL